MKQSFSYQSHTALLLLAGMRSILALLLTFGFGSAIAGGGTAGQNTAYRVSLYDYFQQNYFSAISELLIEKEKTVEDQPHIPSELLRGGILVSYGVDKPARQLLTELKNTNASAENQARAAFYLGKLYYRKGQPAAAVEQFKQVDGALSHKLHGEFNFLLNTAMHQSGTSMKEHEPVDSNINATSASIWSYYNHFNRSLSSLPVHCNGADCEQYYEGDSVDKTIEGLNQLLKKIDGSELLGNSEELLALRDKVYTTLGFISLQAGDNPIAIAAFMKVRKNSSLVGQALLGYGWAASNANDMRKALLPWQQLTLRPVHEASTKEGLLAVPYALEKLLAYDQALTAYNNAAHILEQEMVLLARLQQQVNDNEHYDFVHYLDNAALQWLNYRQLVDIDKSPFKDDRQAFERLQQYQTQQQYVSVSQQLVDASWLKNRLLQWQRDLAVMSYTLDERRRRAQQVINPEYTQALKLRYDQLNAMHAKLVSKSRQILLPNNRELQLVKRIDRAEQRLAALQQQIASSDSHDPSLQKLSIDEASLAETSKILSLMKGKLHWQLAQEHSVRKRHNAKVLHAIEQHLVQAGGALKQITQLEVDVLEQSQHAATLASHRKSLGRHLLLAQTLEAKLQQQIRELFSDEIERQIAQTKIYLAQAQMARARLMDTLSQDGRLVSQVSP
jgi:hypothetical protein